MALVDRKPNDVAKKTKWLFTSKGVPAAFVYEGRVYRYDGMLVGALEGDLVLNGGYVGEILNGEMLVRSRFAPLMQTEQYAPAPPPYLPVLPEPREGTVLPFEFMDLPLD